MTKEQLATQKVALEGALSVFNDVIKPACNARAASLAMLPYSAEATSGILAWNAIIASINASGKQMRKALDDTVAQMGTQVALTGNVVRAVGQD